jgi:hypothetical protein
MTRSRPFNGQEVPADTSLTKLVREGNGGAVTGLLSEIGVLLKRQGSSGKKLEILGYCTVGDVVSIRDQLLGKKQQMRPGMKSGPALQIVNMNPPAGGGRIRKRLKTHR